MLKNPRSDGNTVNVFWPFGAIAKIFRDRGVRFVFGPTKLEPLRILYFNIFDRAGNLLESASSCSIQKTGPRYGSGAGSPLTCQLLHDDSIKVSSTISSIPCGSSIHRVHEH